MTPEPEAAEIMVDVRGMSMNHAEITVDMSGKTIRFVLDPQLKQGRHFHFGAFFSKSVLSADVHRYPFDRRLAVLSESPIDACYRHVDVVARRFPIVLTHQHHLLSRGAPFRGFHFGTNWLGVDHVGDGADVALREAPKSRTVSFIGSLDHPDQGAYRFRREVAEHLVERTDVDCFGKGIRTIDGKAEALAPYRFSVAMENAVSDHYFSEKLVDCLLAGCVPIYYGCPSIGDCFDVRGMHRFETIDELDSILESLSIEQFERMREFAEANRSKAITLRCHSHRALFQRLAEHLPESGLVEPYVHTRTAARVATQWRLLTKR